MRIFPVILCGGSGTRLWPMSRGGYPKQYLRLAGNNSLIQETLLRLRGMENIAAPIIVSNKEQRLLIAEQLRQVEVDGATIVLEPVARNTAPAIAVAALLAMRESPDAFVLVLPSDHVVNHQASFEKLVEDAVHIAKDNYLVTFGICPNEAHTGYGYIRSGAPLVNAVDAFTVEAFVEKPDAATATGFIEDGGYYWNSGMLMLKASTYLEELRRHEPEIGRLAELSLTEATRSGDFISLDEAAFTRCPNISVDYAVLEKTDRAAVITAADLGWSDIGSWDALADITPANTEGNVLLGDVLQEGMSNSYIRAEHRMVAAIGLDNVVIVETADAVLVLHRDKAQSVKSIVEQMSGAGRQESLTHRRVVRPWGSYESIDQGTRFQVKRIVVNPGAQLSLQMHYHRAEHWIVVTGTALVTNGDKQIILTENQSTYIPLGVTHRLFNPGKIPLELIEVQSGSYLAEDDIVRFDDSYGRVHIA